MPIIGTPTAVTGGSGTYTAEAGTHRLVVITLSRRTTDTGTNLNPTVTALTWGSLSVAGGTIVNAASAGIGLGTNTRANVWYVLEANIPAGAQTPTATWSQTMNGSDLFEFRTLTGINQLSPVDGSGTTETHSSGVGSFTGSLTISNNCIQILASAFGGSGTTITPSANWTASQGTGNGNHKVHTEYATSQLAGSLAYTVSISPNTIGALAVASFRERNRPRTLLGVG